MAANPLEHRNWGNTQSWPCPHHHLVAFLNRFQKLEVDLNTTVLGSLHTVTSVASVQLFVRQPLLAVCFKKRQRPHYCGWTLEGSVILSVLCRDSCCCCWDWCCWWCWVKVLCCSGKAAERISWADWFPWSNLDVCRNCWGCWVSCDWAGCCTVVSCCWWSCWLCCCCCCCCCCVIDKVCACCCWAAKVG